MKAHGPRPASQPSIINTQHTTKQVASPRREFPIFELQNGVKYEFVPSVELQYNEFKWQVGPWVRHGG